MTGKTLYDRYRKAMRKQGCDCDDFDDLENIDQAAWNELAESVVPTELAKALAEVVEDFMPNIRICALQDYGRLNDTLIKARAMGLITK